MKPDEETKVVDLVLDVFSEFVAPDFSDEGIEEFKKFVNEASIHERFQCGDLIILARCKDKIIGVIEIRDNSHVALLFVKKSFQKKSIARQLLSEAITTCRKRNPEIQKMTVNASPNAYDAYLNMGFRGKKIVQTVNGIRFIPLELELQ